MECSNESSRASRSDSSTGFNGERSADPSRRIPTWIAIICCLPLIASANGCGRTVLVSEASPIRIGPNARIRVYTLVDGEWTLSKNAVTVSEGWYCVPPSFLEDPRK